MNAQPPNPPSTPGPLIPKSSGDDLSSHLHRQLIGYFGMAMPFLLWFIAGRRPMEGLPSWKLLDSVSAYYYTGSVAIFVGILVALAGFLFTYRGYDNKYKRRDRTAAVIAGFAAVTVALFPTGAPGDISEPSWWTDLTGKIHYLSAVVLFGAFIFFCFFLFPKSEGRKGKTLPLEKRVRNTLYYFCGTAMLVCMALIIILKRVDRSIFWPEAVALEFFAISWLVKGHTEWTLAAVGKWILFYKRHPGRLARDLWGCYKDNG